jgi:leucyl aminopeptidase
MKITCQIGKTEKVKTDALILFAFQERKLPRSLIPVDRAARGQISKLLKSGDFSGKEGEVAVSYPEGKIPARRILVAGLGKKSEVNLET